MSKNRDQHNRCVTDESLSFTECSVSQSDLKNSATESKQPKL